MFKPISSNTQLGIFASVWLALIVFALTTI